MIGMRHLNTALADFNTAADKASFSCGQGACDIVVTGMKEDNLEPSRFILGDDAPGPPGPRRWTVMFHDKDFEGGSAAVDNVIQCRAGAPVDQSHGKVAQQVYDMRADTFFKDAGQFRAHTRQDGGGGKQTKDFCRTFRMHGWSSARKLVSRLQQRRERDKRCGRARFANRF